MSRPSFPAYDPLAPSDVKLSAIPGVRLPEPVQTLWSFARPDEFFERMTDRLGRTFEMSWYPFGRTVVTSDQRIVRDLFTRYGDSGPIGMRTIPGNMAHMLGQHPLLTSEGDAHVVARRNQIALFKRMTLSARVGEDRLRESLDRALSAKPKREPFSFRDLIEVVVLEALLGDGLDVRPGPERDRLVAAGHRWVSSGVHPLLLDSNAERIAGRFSRARATFTAAETDLDRLLHAEVVRHEDCGDDGTPRCVIRMALDETADWMPQDPIGGAVSHIKAMIVGGYHTTAATTAWTLLFLLHNPLTLAAVREEVAAGSTALLEGAVREALRLCPPDQLPVVRVTKADCELGPHLFPADVTIAVNARMLHLDESIYEAPREFRPERFVGRKRPAHEWLPFGGGIRRCLGELLGIERSVSILAAALSGFALEPVHAELEPTRWHGFVHSPKYGAEVVRV
ncbi:cytochrome P450 [Lentzea jiangxiensis]|uniref:Cytochrome P450 n=1 Tax=Lentzea jiangxiensis TaxID=641025 RepID=A0A1H0K2E6_9PSEU|nr:cytochrome P450 [Lentzea jiangxiensis]SDO50185.1 Cytochrome P450 [Lentzea jiangxiensis]